MIRVYSCSLLNSYLIYSPIKDIEQGYALLIVFCNITVEISISSRLDLSQRLVEKVKSQVTTAGFLVHWHQVGEVARQFAKALNVLRHKFVFQEVAKLLKRIFRD